MNLNFLSIYKKLNKYYGPQHWWPADTPFEMMVGAILVQNTNWRNAEKAIENLKPFLAPKKIEEMSEEDLGELIRPSGFYNLKAKRIKSFLNWYKKYSFNIEQMKTMDRNVLRHELLSIHGIGYETADVILLYAFHQPVFVADAYAKRIFGRIGFQLPQSYDGIRKAAEQQMPPDVKLYQEYHALLVEHGKQFCKSKPICKACPLLDICHAGMLNQ